MSTAGTIYFYACALLALAGALGVVVSKNPIRAAMGLLLLILSIAGLFLALHAEFLAAIQLIVYAGAIIILFLFVIMLLGPSSSTPSDRRGIAARVFGGGLFGSVLFADALVPFELSSGLLMVAVLGAMAVARGRQGQKSMSKNEQEVPFPVEATPQLPGQTAGVFSHEIHLHERPETPKGSAT